MDATVTITEVLVFLVTNLDAPVYMVIVTHTLDIVTHTMVDRSTVMYTLEYLVIVMDTLDIV